MPRMFKYCINKCLTPCLALTDKHMAGYQQDKRELACQLHPISLKIIAELH